MTMTLLALGDNATGGGVEGGEKGGRAVADVVVRIFLERTRDPGAGSAAVNFLTSEQKPT